MHAPLTKRKIERVKVSRPVKRRLIRRIEEQTLSTDDLDLIEELACAEAREDFWAYRQYTAPNMLKGWWQEIIAWELQTFYAALVNGERPYLVIESPPQHGKTKQGVDFVSWASGKNPDLKTIFSSYSDDLGVNVNMQLQRIYDSPKYRRVFPSTALSMTNVVEGVGRAKRNSSLLEYVGRDGFFRNTTVEGQVTGQGLDLGWIDDPLKGREEAQSKRIRDKVWNWLVDDFFTRFAEHAGMIFTMTRWHVDDPVSRFREKFPHARVVRFPAIAEKDELYRRKGEALFPEHKSLEFLLERKKAMTIASWESLYQQNPIIVGGGEFPIEKIAHVPKPHKNDCKRSVRYWDKAGTVGAGAFTCGALVHILKNGSVVVGDIARGQWGSLEREQRIKQLAEIDRQEYPSVKTWIEQEPGSGGKESAERTISNLKGYAVFKDPVHDSKGLRAEPFAAQVQGGNVGMVAAPWNKPYLEELEAWPNWKYKDQVDASAGAFAKAASKGYDTSFSWVG